MITRLLDWIFPWLQFYELRVENMTKDVVRVNLKRRFRGASGSVLQFHLPPKANLFWCGEPGTNVIARRGMLRIVISGHHRVRRTWTRDGTSYRAKVCVDKRGRKDTQ